MLPLFFSDFYCLTQNVTTCGNQLIIGRRVEQLRKAKKIKQKDFIAQLQVAGLDINPTSYSKLEGQLRIATDKEVFMIAKVLDVPLEALFGNEI